MNSTSWGSLFATLSAVLGGMTAFVPPQYQVWVGGAAAVAGTIATKIQ